MKKIIYLVIALVLALGLALPVAVPAAAQTATHTGARLPTATSGPCGTPEGAYDSDPNTDAGFLTDTMNQQYFNFNFDGVIPSGAIINGIQVDLSAYQKEDYAHFSVKLYNGTSWSNPKDTPELASHYIGSYTLGGPSDQWGLSWVAGDFSNANFNLEIVPYLGGDNSLSLTSISVDVYYTMPSSYNFGGFLPPIKADGSGVFKLGSTVPVKFQLTDASGKFVSNAVATISLQKYDGNAQIGNPIDGKSTSAATTGNRFRYDPASNQYIFNLATKGLSVGKWQIRVTLDDGGIYTVFISLR